MAPDSRTKFGDEQRGARHSSRVAITNEKRRLTYNAELIDRTKPKNLEMVEEK
jgi:hypothetical protein